jgi:hypothetical protein
MEEDALLERLADIIATIMKNEDENRALAEEYRTIRKQISDAVKAANDDALKSQENNIQES